MSLHSKQPGRQSRVKDKDRNEKDWEKAKSNLAFVKSDTWPFADQMVIVLTVLYKTVCCQNVRCTLCSYCKASEFHSSVCLFHCVRVFLTCGFKKPQSLHPESRGALNTSVFQEQNKQIRQIPVIDSTFLGGQILIK